MKKLSFILCILAVTIWSCSKKSDPPSTASTTNGTTTSSTTSTGTNCVLATLSGANGYLETFVYNSAGQLTRDEVRQNTTSATIKDTFNYNPDGTLYYIDLIGNGNWRVLYYSKNKTLKEIDEYRNYKLSTYYTLDTLSGSKPKTVYYYDKTLAYDHTDLTWDGNGNITQETDKDASLKVQSYTKYEYDNNKNIYALQFRFLYDALAFGNWGTNNCTKITTYDVNNAVTSTDVITYTYDSKGNAITSSDSYTGQKLNYTYNCK